MHIPASADLCTTAATVAAGESPSRPAWRVGMRVATRRGLVDDPRNGSADSKPAAAMYYPAGTCGSVKALGADGATATVSFDNSACDPRLCGIYLRDLVPRPNFAVGEAVRVWAFTVQLSATAGHIEVPAGTRGRVVRYSADCNVYTIRFSSLRLIADVGAWKVQPVDHKTATPAAAQTPPPRKQHLVQADAAVAAATPPSRSPKRASLTLSVTSSTSSEASASEAVLSTSVSSAGTGASRSPEYSNITASPRSRSSARALVTLNLSPAGSPAASPRARKNVRFNPNEDAAAV